MEHYPGKYTKASKPYYSTIGRSCNHLWTRHTRAVSISFVRFVPTRNLGSGCDPNFPSIFEPTASLAAISVIIINKYTNKCVIVLIKFISSLFVHRSPSALIRVLLGSSKQAAKYLALSDALSTLRYFGVRKTRTIWQDLYQVVPRP